MNSIEPRPNSPSTPASATSSSGAAWFDGTPRPSCATCSSSCDDVNPIAPSRIAARTSSLHRGDLVVGRGALRRVVAHHEAAHRAVTDVRAHVDADAAVEVVEEVAERCRRANVDAGRERVAPTCPRRG